MKRIILEYSSLPLFGSFNGDNGKFIPLFGSLDLVWEFRSCLGEGNGMEMNEKNNFRIFFPSLVWEF